jgi:hypothetical protein
MVGPLGTAGTVTNVQNGTSALIPTPNPGPLAGAVSKYDRIAQELFGCIDYADYIHTKLTSTPFLKRLVTRIHPEAVKALQAAAPLAMTSLGNTYESPEVSSTLRERKAMHAFGMAIDFDVLENPYILNESGEADLDKQLIVVYDHIAEFILGRSQSVLRYIGQGRQAIVQGRLVFGNGSVGDVYDALKEESDAMMLYFALMKDSGELTDYLQNKWPANHRGQTAPAANTIQSQMRTDYMTLGGADASGSKLPTGQKGVDRPFAPISGQGQGDPSCGFLNLDKDFVIALTTAGFAWGAIDFGMASGDMQHFDTRLLNIGRKVCAILLSKT